MDNKEKAVLDAMKKAGKVTSPKVCYYAPAK